MAGKKPKSAAEMGFFGAFRAFRMLGEVFQVRDPGLMGSAISYMLLYSMLVLVEMPQPPGISSSHVCLTQVNNLTR